VLVLSVSSLAVMLLVPVTVRDVRRDHRLARDHGHVGCGACLVVEHAGAEEAVLVPPDALSRGACVWPQ
jgi:hypothetical protein